MTRETRATRSLTIDTLPIEVFATAEDLGAAAAEDAATAIRAAYAQRGEVNVVFSTGNSSLTFFRALRAIPDLPWEAIRVFPADQYTGVDEDEFGTYAFLKKHLLPFVTPLEVCRVPSESDDVEARCRAHEALLRRHPLDLATIGFGENGHIAFNDPHNTSFEDPLWVRTVELSMESRRQPVNEGRFPSLDSVPTHAVTMTIPALLSAPTVLCIVPEGRKAEAVRKNLTEPISETRPGSILRRVRHVRLYLDVDSAARLEV
jgi:glucosamine-6-phosphate deaminase